MSRPQRHGSPVERPIVTVVLIAISVALYVYDLATLSSFFTSDGIEQVGSRPVRGLGDLALFAPSLDLNGEWYRVISSGFVHFSPMHLGFNMWLLWQIGKMIEGRFGSLSFATLYVAGLLGGSLGATIIEPTSPVGGASGAVFALMGATGVLQQLAGQSIFRSPIGRLLMLNVAISFLPGVSLGGHMGGLAAGLVAGLLLGLAQRYGRGAPAAVPVAIAGFAFVLFLATIPAAARAAEIFLA